MKENKRNGALDFLKFIFSFFIVTFHAKNFAGDENWIFFGASVFVEFFFMVSGFMMASYAARRELNTSLGQDTFQFMKRKIFGLMPNYYVAWLISFFVLHLDRLSEQRLMLEHALSSIWELLLVTDSGLMGYRANNPAWYIAAMLLAMFVLYPFMRKFGNSFFYMLAPLVLIFLMGYTYQEFRHLRANYVWMGFVYNRLLRAMIGLLFGCICFKITEKLKKIEFTKLARILFSIVEWGGYGLIIGISYRISGSKYDWTYVLILAVLLIITTSQVGILSDLFQSRVFTWLGAFSYSLYLGHGALSHKMEFLFPDLGYWKTLPIYWSIAILSGLIIMYSSLGLKKLWVKIKPKVLSLFIIS